MAFGVSFSGLDYVSHEDILPYSSTDQVPIQHELFERFLMYDQTKGNSGFSSSSLEPDASGSLEQVPRTHHLRCVKITVWFGVCYCKGSFLCTPVTGVAFRGGAPDTGCPSS